MYKRCEGNVEQAITHPATVPRSQQNYELYEEWAVSPLRGAPAVWGNFSDSPGLRASLNS
jgi:hypothetical protein